MLTAKSLPAALSITLSLSLSSLSHNSFTNLIILRLHVLGNRHDQDVIIAKEESLAAWARRVAVAADCRRQKCLCGTRP
jgi:hypothetical protein